MKKYWLPADEKGRQEWLTNFSSKLGTHASLVGISAGEVTDVAAFLAMLIYILALDQAVNTLSQDLTEFKKRLMLAPIGSPIGTIPTITIGAPPTATPAGIFTIIRGMVKRIKGHVKYTVNMGEDLGIIGSDFVDDFENVKPVLKITMDVGKPKLKYKKQRTDGINLYADHDDGGGMKFMKFISKATFTDPTNLQPAQNSAVWKYLGIYVVNDEEVGIAGDETAVTVRRIV